MAEGSTGNVETRLTQSAGHQAADDHASNSASAPGTGEPASAENITPPQPSESAANVESDSKNVRAQGQGAGMAGRVLTAGRIPKNQL
jgi:hypothetical protein